MLRIIRRTLAFLFFTGITLLFLDITGVIHHYLGWMAKVQLLPAILALNIGVVACLIVLTLIFGRIYCSVICPLGVMQDLLAHLRFKKNKYGYVKANPWLRYGFLIAFIVGMVAPGLNAIAVLIAPYSAFGRIASSLLQPLYGYANNALAYLAERSNSYLFYTVDVYWKAGIVLAVAIVTLIVLAVMAWTGGRRYCNTICPVGTILGFFSRFSLFKVRIEESKCVKCGLCAKNCKSSCINSQEGKIDYSRCVTCGNCLGKCHTHALSYGIAHTCKDSKKEGLSRRGFLGVVGIATYTIAKAQTDKKVDGGLALIEDKKVPKRNGRIVPAGAQSIRHLDQHCVSCQLCIDACPNGVLRPSIDLDEHLMHPYSSYEKGYCRPECTRCSEVCPAGAIKPITAAEKSSIQIGRARVIAKNCLAINQTIGEGENAHPISCGNCARHCPTGAITMMPVRPLAEGESDWLVAKRPVVDETRCIGCGACENLCPARPFSAIVVDGFEEHKEM